MRAVAFQLPLTTAFRCQTETPPTAPYTWTKRAPFLRAGQRHSVSSEDGPRSSDEERAIDLLPDRCRFVCQVVVAQQLCFLRRSESAARRCAIRMASQVVRVPARDRGFFSRALRFIQ